MADHRFDWLPRQQPPTHVLNEYLCDFWTLRGAADRNITCAAFRVLSGIELRVFYSAEEMISTKLYRGPKADEQVAEAADAIRLTMLGTGFREIAPV